MTTPHKHKDVLIAIANGLPVTEVEVKHSTWSWWEDFEEHTFDVFKYPHSWEMRIKPKPVMFNGVELPEPVTETPKCGDLVYVPRPDHPDNYVAFTWIDGSCDQTVLARGLVHATKENAIEWALAMTPVTNR